MAAAARTWDRVPAQILKLTMSSHGVSRAPHLSVCLSDDAEESDVSC